MCRCTASRRASRCRIPGTHLLRPADTRSRSGATIRSSPIRCACRDDFMVTARDRGRRRHGASSTKREPVAAVQFHPESIMTLGSDAGMRMIENVVAHLAKGAMRGDRPSGWRKSGQPTNGIGTPNVAASSTKLSVSTTNAPKPAAIDDPPAVGEIAHQAAARRELEQGQHREGKSNRQHDLAHHQRPGRVDADGDDQEGRDHGDGAAQPDREWKSARSPA